MLTDRPRFALANGTRIERGRGWCCVTLPNGKAVHARPDADSPRMAEALGYGADVDRMTHDHDALHALLTDWLGLPYSFSLMAAAGEPIDPALAAEEEAAVLALQRFVRAADQNRRTA